MGKKVLEPKLPPHSSKDTRQSGQILLIVILSMVVALTVGLSVISHTVTNIKTSKQNEESQKAFQAAESGLDQAMKNIGSVGDITNGSLPEVKFTDNNSSVTVNINPANSSFVNNGETINQDEGYDIWLSSYPSFDPTFNGSIDLYWDEGLATNSCAQNSGDGADPSIRPALEVLLFYGSTTDVQLFKKVYDPCSGRVTNADTTLNGGPFLQNGKLYQYKVSIPSISNGLIMKVVPLFNSTTMAVATTGSTLPSQGKIIESTGKSGETVRKLQYFISYPQIPAEIMQYAIISQ